MSTNRMELNLDAMEIVSGGADTATKAVVSGFSVGSCALTGGMFGSLAGPVGTAVGAAIGGAVGGIGAAVIWLVN